MAIAFEAEERIARSPQVVWERLTDREQRERPGARPYWHHVRRAQLDLIERHPDALLGADPDTLFYTTADGVHYDANTLRRIAREEREALGRVR